MSAGNQALSAGATFSLKEAVNAFAALLQTALRLASASSSPRGVEAPGALLGFGVAEPPATALRK